MERWIFTYHDEEENGMEKEKKEPEKGEVAGLWDYIMAPHRKKREARQAKKEEEEKEPIPKKRSTKKINKKPEEKEVTYNDTNQDNEESPKRGKYEVTERTYYTDEPPKRREQPTKPDTRGEDSPTRGEERGGNEGRTPEAVEVASSDDGKKSEPDSVDGV